MVVRRYGVLDAPTRTTAGANGNGAAGRRARRAARTRASRGPTPATRNAREEHVAGRARATAVLASWGAKAAVARFGETFLVDDPRREGEEHDLLEAELRELARRGAVSISLIAATVASLGEWLARTGADLDEPGTRADYLRERMATATATRWPPPRNGSCWCESAVKYKKCWCRASAA